MKKAFVTQFALGAALLLVAAAPFLVLAQGNIPPQTPPITTPGQVTTGLQNVVAWMSTIFWILAVGYVIWAAFTFLSAGGDAEKVGTAKKQILYAVIAAVVALLANGIFDIVTNLLKGK